MEIRTPEHLTLLQEIVRKHESLSLQGFNCEQYLKWAGEDFDGGRLKMITDPKHVEAFAWCMEFLHFIQKQVSINRNFPSYPTLKHCIERFAKDRECHIYVPNGILIAAAYASGFKVQQDTTHAYINAKLRRFKNLSGIFSGKLKVSD